MLIESIIYEESRVYSIYGTCSATTAFYIKIS